MRKLAMCYFRRLPFFIKYDWRIGSLVIVLMGNENILLGEIEAKAQERKT